MEDMHSVWTITFIKRNSETSYEDIKDKNISIGSSFSNFRRKQIHKFISSEGHIHISSFHDLNLKSGRPPKRLAEETDHEMVMKHDQVTDDNEMFNITARKLNEMETTISDYYFHILIHTKPELWTQSKH